MGMLFSKIWSRMLGNQEMKILMLGLDAAGKTTILYRLKLAEVVTTIPTVARCLRRFSCFEASLNADGDLGWLQRGNRGVQEHQLHRASP